MKVWFVISALLMTSICHSQENLGNIDSLKASLRAMPIDSNRVLRLCDISYSYRFVNVDSGHHYAQQALDLSQRLNYKNGRAWAYLLLGVTNSIHNQVPEAVLYFEKSYNLADSVHNHTVIIRSLANMGWCVFDLEDYYKAIDYFKRALHYQENFVGQDGYFITLQINIGQSYLANHNLAEAEHYLNQALAHGTNNVPNYGYMLNMLGALRIEQHRYSSADSLLQTGWILIDSLPDKVDRADNRFYFAKLKLAQGELQKALDYAMDALRFYQQVGSREDREHIYELLSTIESKRGRTQQSLDYLLMSNALRDSVHNSQASYSEFLFNENEQRRELLLQQKDNDLLQAEKRNQKIIWISSSLIFVGIIAALSFFVWQNQRTNKKLLILNDELVEKEAAIEQQNALLQEMNLSKDQLFSIIGHDLRSPLILLSQFIKMLSDKSAKLSEEEVREYSRDLDGYLKNLSNLLENLLEWSLSEMKSIHFEPEQFDVFQSLAENEELFRKMAQNKEILIVNESPPGLLVNAHRNSVNTVIRNLISNAIKFTNEGGKITLNANRVNGNIQISIADTGIGMRQDIAQNIFSHGIINPSFGTANEKGSGLGLLLCKTFVEKNGGTITVSSVEGEGSEFYFTLPASVPS